MRLLRVGQPLPAPQTLGPARGVVCLRAGERTAFRDNQSLNRAPASSVSYSKNADPSPRKLRPREIRHLRRVSLTALDKAFMRPSPNEVGDAWSPQTRTTFRQDGVAGVVAATPFGVITVAGSVGDAGRRKIFFSLGRLF